MMRAALGLLCTFAADSLSSEKTAVLETDGYKAPVAPLRARCVPESQVSPDFMHARREYFPGQEKHHSSVSAPQKVTEATLHAARSLNHLLSFVTGNDCSLSSSFRPRPLENGFGSTLSSLVKPIFHAIKYGYCLKTPHNLTLYKGSSCPHGRWSCYLESWSDSGCAPVTLPDTVSSGPVESAHAAESSALKSSFTSTSASSLADKDIESVSKNVLLHPQHTQLGQATSLGTKSIEKVKEPTFRTKDPHEMCVDWWELQREPLANQTVHGTAETDIQTTCANAFSYRLHKRKVFPEDLQRSTLFFVVSRILSFVVRPSHALHSRIVAKKKRIGWDNAKRNGVIGLHVRLGDSCAPPFGRFHEKGRTCDPLSAYMPSLRKMSSRYGIKNVYLATDSHEPLNDSKAYPEFNWIFDQRVRRDANQSIEELLIRQQIDGSEEASDALSDIWLLSECDAFVGKFTSNMDRIAYSLMYSHGSAVGPKSEGCYRPFVSLDAPWCFDADALSGRSIYGPFWC